MKQHLFPLLGLGLVILLTAAWAGAQGPPDHAGNKTIPPVKNKVTVDKVSGEICIEGENSQRPLRPGLIFS